MSLIEVILFFNQAKKKEFGACKVVFYSIRFLFFKMTLGYFDVEND